MKATDLVTSGDIRAALTVAYLAAAMAEATEFQQRKLNELITIEDMEEFRADGSDLNIQLAINAVMGERWIPSDQALFPIITTLKRRLMTVEAEERAAYEAARNPQ
jgi:hypothetical protein